MSQKKTFHPPHPPKQNPLFNNNSNNNNSNKGSIKPNNTTIYTGFDNINVSNIEYGFGNNSHNLSNYFTSNNLSNNNLFNQVDQEIIKISNLSNDLEKTKVIKRLAKKMYEDSKKFKLIPKFLKEIYQKIKLLFQKLEGIRKPHTPLMILSCTRLLQLFCDYQITYNNFESFNYSRFIFNSNNDTNIGKKFGYFMKDYKKLNTMYNSMVYNKDINILSTCLDKISHEDIMNIFNSPQYHSEYDSFLLKKYSDLELIKIKLNYFIFDMIFRIHTSMRQNTQNYLEEMAKDFFYPWPREEVTCEIHFPKT